MIAGTLWLIGINTAIFSAGVFFWKKVWVQRFGISVPESPEQLYTVKEVFQILANKLWHMDPEYWIGHSGIDGYLYILFQKYMVVLLLVYSVLTVTASVPMNLISPQEDNFLTRSTLHSNMPLFYSWYQTGVTYLFSVGVFTAIYLLRGRANQVLSFRARKRSQEKEHEWLMQRTVHVQGLDFSDLSGEALAMQFDQFLRERGGHVVEALLFPDYQKLIQLEVERDEAILMYKLLENPPPPMKCAPRSMLTQDYYERRLREIEHETDQVTLAPNWNSGHAVVVLNSLESLDKVIYHYRPSILKSFKLGITNIAVKWTQFRSRAISTTFERFEDNREAAHTNIVVSQSKDPIDIVWANLGGTRGFYYFRRLGVLTLATLVILFLSTPASLLAQIKSAVGVLEVNWVENLPQPIYKFIQAYLPSFFIVLLNQLLLVLIDISAYMEKHFSHSDCQSSILHKAVIYLSLNMLIIPGITLAASESLVKILREREFLLADILGEIHLADSGAFFVNLLLQKACFSSMFYLLRGPDIISNYCSVWLAYHFRKDLNSHDKWRRKENQIFQYGYFYALMLTSFGIIMTFCTTIPLVIPAGLVFFVAKWWVDSVNILTGHGCELESDGRLLRIACNYVYIFVLFYQVSIIGCFAIANMRFQAFLVFVLFLGSIFYCLNNSWHVYDLKSSDEDYFASLNEMSQETLTQWRKRYTHPLALALNVH